MKSGITKLDHHKDEIIAMYTTGSPMQTIAKAFGCSGDTVGRLLTNNGITLRSTQDARVANGTNRKNKIENERAFQVIDSEEKAYWLGFLVADGYIKANHDNTNQYYVRLKLAAKDLEHLNKFKDFMGYGGQIRTYADGYPSVTISSRTLVEDISNYIVIANKTHDVRRPTLNPELYKHFWRGVFDGDGWVSQNANVPTNFIWGCVGNFVLMSEFQDFIVENTSCGRTKIYNKNGNNAWHLTYGGRKVVTEIYNALGGDSALKLDRKLGRIMTIIRSKYED